MTKPDPAAESPDDEFYIVDLRPEWTPNPYVTVWRPKNSNYTYALSEGGRYKRSELRPGYHANQKGGRMWQNFPVPCAAVEALTIPLPVPGPSLLTTGPVVPNTAANRKKLRAARVFPAEKNMLAA